jgi:acyl-coenzyme A synthetase/AMP-(fatty) acid ligase
VWYSTPSILSLMMQYGKPARHVYPALRLVFFAGEVFPVGHLREVTRAFPGAYFNLYGPTETNVCTWHPIPAVVPDDRTDPYPIGRVCRHLASRVVGPDGAALARGEEGELCIAGANVMQAYWNLPEQSARAFIVDPDGTRWYRTGDIVREGEDGVFAFLGRRDRMVKRRGYRIELGEIEAALYRHEGVREAAAVAGRDAAGDVRITAYLALREGAVAGTVAMKRYCAEALPLYMVPDAFEFRPSLPKTSTDKVDYQALLGGS